MTYMLTTDDATKGDGTVPKRQKNSQLDEALCDVVEQLQRTTGATFSRTLSAALLKYVFGSLDPIPSFYGRDNNELWMTLAIDIEKGRRGMSDIPAYIVERTMLRAKVTIPKMSKALKKSKNSDEFDRQHKADSFAMKNWSDWQRRSKQFMRDWSQSVSNLGPVDAFQKLFETGGFPTLVSFVDPDPKI